LILDKAGSASFSHFPSSGVESTMPSKSSPSKAALPLEAWATALVLVALLPCAWAWLFRMSAVGDIYICRVPTAAPAAAIGMWVVMMVAMMTPSALPMILGYAQLTGREPSSSRLGRVAAFVAVYLAVLSGFGILAALVESLLVRGGLVRDGQIVNPLYAGALLVIAGLYQWSAVKAVCLAHCHVPSAFLRERYAAGIAGALKLGFGHSMACVGCCWVLMLLAWIGGTMNLAWMAVLTLFVALEKLLGTRAAVLRLSALVLLGAGIVQIVMSLR
jgi:predicted metal-binding membrane protein